MGKRSRDAFIEAVAAEGEAVPNYDAAGGDIELLRIQWASLLKMVNYSEEQLNAVRDALTLCGAIAEINEDSVITGKPTYEP